MAIIGGIIELVLSAFIVLLFVRLIVDWIQIFARSWVPRGPVLVVLEGVYSATDPPVKALRKVIPPLRLGGVAIDLSFVALRPSAWFRTSRSGQSAGSRPLRTFLRTSSRLTMIGSQRSLNALIYAAQADNDRDVRHSAQFAVEVIRTNLRGN